MRTKAKQKPWTRKEGRTMTLTVDEAVNILASVRDALDPRFVAAWESEAKKAEALRMAILALELVK